MKVIMPLGWGINTLKPGIKGKDKNFLGDEMTGNSIRSALLEYADIEYCELVCSEHGVGVEDSIGQLDVAVDLNRTCRDRERAKHQLWYFQNGEGEGTDRTFELYAQYYDGIIFAAKKAYDKYKDFKTRSGHGVVFMPLAADPHLFHPVDPDPAYAFDVAYCGNDIKRHRTMPYLGPAMQYNFGLFGRWSEEHRELLGPISKGQIDFEQLRKLYSSSRAIINIHYQDCLDWGLWAGRIYDVLACEGFLISDRPYGIPEEFDKHVVWSLGGENLAEQLEYFLADPERTKPFREGAREFITRNHTWKHRTEILHNYLQEFK